MLLLTLVYFCFSTVALHELACCFIDANRPSDALPLLRRGYDVLLQAVDNTGPFEGQTGIALASLLFTLARCCQLLLVDSVGAAGTSTALRTVPPEETKMIATVEHALTVCLYLEVTLLGVHPDTMNTYSELGQWFSGQRRWAFMVNLAFADPCSPLFVSLQTASCLCLFFQGSRVRDRVAGGPQQRLLVPARGRGYARARCRGRAG